MNQLSERRISLWQLLISVLKVGSISFGGYMALVSILRDELVDRRRVLKDEVIMDAVALASIFPGPLAVNIVIYVGYKLRGKAGMLIAFTGIILPAFVLVYILTYLYFEYGDVLNVEPIFKGVMPAVGAIILSVAIKMTKSHIRHRVQVLLLLISIATLLTFTGFKTIIVLVAGGAILGYLFFRHEVQGSNDLNEIPVSRFNGKDVQVVALALVAVAGVLLALALFGEKSMVLQLISVFSAMSLSLFGGGYVFIPMMQEVVVESLGWLSNAEFIDGIALGQVSPGPIMISSVFIGYKVMGITGALVATAAMFLPSGILMVAGSQMILRHSDSILFKSAMKGVYAVTIGMIFNACVKIGMGLEVDVVPIAIFLVGSLCLIRYKMNLIYVILSAGLAGSFFM
ncbi:chromate efflux transporter [Marinoscillum sp. 108]|uniref:chromate efflux transporter n=1 Tax=Marinoscillum sp. 108 TaxID=2653151 RepID=UPI0012F356D2|nr:chromate efflux transporter [Marinoscillum sp. 108]VXD14360.1 Chromate transporter [Marinoscillum sp. 108]